MVRKRSISRPIATPLITSDIDDSEDVALPTIYLPNEPSQLSQHIPNLNIENDYDEYGKALKSRSDEIRLQIEDQEEKDQQQDDDLTFLPRNRENNFEQDSAVESTEDTSTDDSQNEDEAVDNDNEYSKEFEDYSIPHYESCPIASESTYIPRNWILLTNEIARFATATVTARFATARFVTVTVTAKFVTATVTARFVIATARFVTAKLVTARFVTGFATATVFATANLRFARFVTARFPIVTETECAITVALQSEFENNLNY
ncbi:hypothetical protein C1646_772303 [Rhizophagus diaphanus]|nr:hypothetical protein C1646_772303 [Rhizophagus diaphanus] [Rhizophagus sp. MUCL 43196]